MGQRKKRRKATGGPPGVVVVDPNAPLPAIVAYGFGPEKLEESPLSDIQGVVSYKERFPLLWLDVDGLGDVALIQGLGQVFGIHELTLEDVAHTEQRAKIEHYEGYSFMVLQALTLSQDRLEKEQISLVLGPDFVITFQERKPGDPFEQVRARLRTAGSQLRKSGADYLAYTLVDSVIDAYFPILEQLGDRFDDLEEAMIRSPERRVLSQIHFIKRDLLTLRRAVWPLREAIGLLSRSDDAPFQAGTRVYLRDSYDHTVQIIEIIENYRELAASLMDLYHSTLSNRLSEVMKILTVISTIFVPLTFIAGLYGMNFNHDNKPWNMPELHWYWGYPACLGLMGSVAGGQLYYYYRKGWFRRESASKDLQDAQEEQASGQS